MMLFNVRGIVSAWAGTIHRKLDWSQILIGTKALTIRLCVSLIRHIDVVWSDVREPNFFRLKLAAGDSSIKSGACKCITMSVDPDHLDDLV